jgi:hypothetical protein
MQPAALQHVPAEETDDVDMPLEQEMELIRRELMRRGGDLHVELS